MPNRTSGLPHQLIALLHESNQYLHSFLAFEGWATPVNGPNAHQMIIYSDKRPSGEHVRQCHGSQTSEIAAIFPKADGGIV